MQSGDVQTVYVGPNDKAQLKCLSCGSSRTVDVGKFKGCQRPLTLQCKCKSASQVFLEFRKTFRKKTNLEGVYTVPGRNDERGRIVVQNLSKKGVGFITLSTHRLCNDDDIQVVFTLDDRKKSRIEKNAVVRNSAGNYVGCEFTGKDQYDIALGFYLMP